MTQSPPFFDAYPVEVGFPDIRPHAEGNTGIAYVHTFDSGLPGPHVMINALTHGNEVCGAIAVSGLLEHGLRPRLGRLTLAFANVDAYARFDAARPDASRFVDQDFNRVWTAAVLDDTTQDSSELRRARAMRPVIDTVDLLLDLHSMHEKSRPLIVSGPLDKGIALSKALGAPADIIVDEGHPEGRRMRDYADFGDPASPRNALLVECGQHWEAGAVDVARDCTARFLLNAGIVEAADLPAGWLRPLPAAQRVVRVTEPVVAASMDFRFAGAYTGLETFAEAGTVIGWRDGQPVTTPYPNCVLVMPSLRQLRPGVTVVRLGRLDS
ncbi:Succinylglutamate desuccinylase / Aspartoacylase family protein [Cupriavidus sp. YR651]|uniref:M14 family metallopeptidase n=1 Tax=Cupriavidus sp. YR651 TaxID=1855315 RepID=UPI00088600AC|nr:M14 family metallopeptidase [Cupriavidus sp. YR651]SDD12591.1 Succinylglutamate desuccinylase / Aspartoacylase family protein [Cupriavidus sp. YR651]